MVGKIREMDILRRVSDNVRARLVPRAFLKRWSFPPNEFAGNFYFILFVNCQSESVHAMR